MRLSLIKALLTHEGMWLPILINKLKNVDLEKMGLQLSVMTLDEPF